MFFEKIVSNKEKIIKWQKELLTILHNKNYYFKQKTYLIRQSYLEKYENLFLKIDIKNYNENLQLLHEKFDSIYEECSGLLKILRTKNHNLKELPRIFPLNYEACKIFSNKALNKDNNDNFPEVEGITFIFSEGLFKIEISNSFYLFFFQHNEFLRQGFLRFKSQDLSGNQMIKLEQDGPDFFVKNNNGDKIDKIDDNEFYINREDFDLYIFSKSNINQEKVKIEFEKINEEKMLKFKSQTMKILPGKLNILNIHKVAKNISEKVKENLEKSNHELPNIFNSSISISYLRRKTVNNNPKYDSNKNNSSSIIKENNVIKEEKEEVKNIQDTNQKKENDIYQDNNNLYENINNNPENNDIQGNKNLSYSYEMIKNSQIDYGLKNSIIIENNKGEQNSDEYLNEDMIPLNLENIQSFVLPEETTAGLVGLSNIGATCYMNATLQCFSNVEFLRDELLSPNFYTKLEQNKVSKMRLSFAFAEVLKNLWLKYDVNYYPPEHFKEVISDMNPLFRGVAANDSKDLILFMLETMHNELKTVNMNIIVDNNFIPDERNLEEVYKDFSNYYLSKNKSIIFDIFYGCTNIVTSCIYCKTESHNVQVNNIIFFPLEEVRKFKNYSLDTPVKIYDCFEYNQRTEIYDSYYCNYCHNNNSTVISFNRYLYTPKVIIINLNRGKGIQFNVKVNFEEFLDIRNFVVAKESPYKYELIGVICHYGESGMGGHFIAFCKHFNNIGCKWYKFNDAMVNESNFDEVQTSGMPYVLFYSYIDVAD